MTNYAFWLSPDWSGGTNLRDPGNQPFWMLDPLPYEPDPLPVRVEPPAPTPKWIEKEAMHHAKRLGFDSSNWKPRWLCRALGRHTSVIVYSRDPTHYEWHAHAKCCNLSGYVHVLIPEPEPKPVSKTCAHFSCHSQAIGEASDYCHKHHGKPYCRGEFCYNKRDDSGSLWCKKCDPDPGVRPKDRVEQQFGVPFDAKCKQNDCYKTRTFGSLLCKDHLADRFDKTYLDKHPSAKPCAVPDCKRPARPIRKWESYCIDHAPKYINIRDTI